MPWGVAYFFAILLLPSLFVIGRNETYAEKYDDNYNNDDFWKEHEFYHFLNESESFTAIPVAFHLTLE